MEKKGRILFLALAFIIATFSFFGFISASCEDCNIGLQQCDSSSCAGFGANCVYSNGFCRQDICMTCGNGLFNICDVTECMDLSPECVFVNGQCYQQECYSEDATRCDMNYPDRLFSCEDYRWTSKQCNSPYICQQDSSTGKADCNEPRCGNGKIDLYPDNRYESCDWGDWFNYTEKGLKLERFYDPLINRGYAPCPPDNCHCSSLCRSVIGTAEFKNADESKDQTPIFVPNLGGCDCGDPGGDIISDGANCDAQIKNNYLGDSNEVSSFCEVKAKLSYGLLSGSSTSETRIDLPPRTYKIKIELYENGILKSESEEEITLDPNIGNDIFEDDIDETTFLQSYSLGSLKKDDPDNKFSCNISVKNSEEKEMCTSSDMTGDIDKDLSQKNIDSPSFDCDDWPYDEDIGCFSGWINYESQLEKSWQEYLETRTCLGSNCQLLSRNQFASDYSRANRALYCYNDTNNDGAGDYARCGFCRNPSMGEQVDNVDNNCGGKCRVNLEQSCNIYRDYSGDGADSGPVTTICTEYRYDGYDVECTSKIPFNCGGLKNEYGTRDDFCQMTDEGACSSGYQRAVKWIEIKSDEITVEPEYSSLKDIPGKNTYNLVVYKPGAISSQLSTTKFESKIFSNTDTQCFIGRGLESGAFEYYNEGSSQFLWNSFDLEIYNTFKPLNESSGKTRETQARVFSDTMIDSMRGECNFADFWKKAGRKISERDSAGQLKYKWNSVCVPIDKCADDSDNDGPENILESPPFNDYLTDVVNKIEFVDSDGNLESQDLSIPLISLKDVDDPQCNFKDYQKFTQPIPGELNEYSFMDHRISPITENPYCLDEDSDGFCGCIIKTIKEPCDFDAYNSDEPNCNCTKWGQKAGVKDPLSGTISYTSVCVEAEILKNVCDEESTKAENYLVSNSFKDCDDNESDDKQYWNNQKNERLLTSPAIGWFNQYSNKPFGAWNVHPFAPKTPNNCDFEFDVDCNKDLVNNLEFFKGESPFDVDDTTGLERMSVNSGLKNRDMICYSEDPYNEAYAVLGLTLAVPAVLLVATPLISVIGVPSIAVAIPLEITGGAYTSWEIGKCFGIASVEGIRYNDATLANPDSAFWTCTRSFLSGAASTLGVVQNWRVLKIIANGKYPLLMKMQQGKIEAYNSWKDRRIKQLTDPRDVTPPNPGCFLENTSITMADGSTKDIEDIKIGDIVSAYDLENKTTVDATVTKTFVRNQTSYMIIKYEVKE